MQIIKYSKRKYQQAKLHYLYLRALVAITNLPTRGKNSLYIKATTLDIAVLVGMPIFCLVTILCNTRPLWTDIMLLIFSAVVFIAFLFNLHVDRYFDNKLRKFGIGATKITKNQLIEMHKEDHELIMHVAKVLAHSYSGQAKFDDTAKHERKYLSKLVKKYGNK